jgi:hypothetical protein
VNRDDAIAAALAAERGEGDSPIIKLTGPDSLASTTPPCGTPPPPAPAREVEKS